MSCLSASRRVAISLVWLGSVASPLEAQLRLPEVAETGSIKTVKGAAVRLPVTPAHAEADLAWRTAGDRVRLSADGMVEVSNDSLRALQRIYAAEWLAMLPDSTIRGFLYQDHGLLALASGNDPLAGKSFATWSGDRRASLPDRISVALTMVLAYADASRPERLVQAERALEQLHTIAPAETKVLLKAHEAMLRAYYDVGQRAKVIAHGEQMVAVTLAVSDYKQRAQLLEYGGVPYDILGQAYSGERDGPTRLARLMQRVRAGALLTEAERVKLGEMAARLQARYGVQVEQKIAQVELWGTMAPAIQAHAFFNASPDTNRAAQPSTRSLADGTVRVLEFGNVSCAACMVGLAGMERLNARLRKMGRAEVMFVTETIGCWGVDLLSPDEEVAKLRTFYTRERGVTYPVAVWAGDKVTLPDGGLAPAPSPNDSAFKLRGAPNYVIVDGQGKIRYISIGYSEDQLKRFERIVAYLLSEEARTETVETSAAPSTPTTISPPAPSRGTTFVLP